MNLTPPVSEEKALEVNGYPDGRTVPDVKRDEIIAEGYDLDKATDSGALFANDYQKPVAVTGVTLTPATASVEVDATVQLTATVAPDDAYVQDVTFSSSDETKATVDATGLVTGVAVGSATVTVTTVDGEKTDTTAVTVTAAE